MTKFTDDEIAKALRKNGGICAAAAEALSASKEDDRTITRQAIEYRVKKNPELKAAAEDAREIITDLAESKLVNSINKGDAWAVRFWLTTKGKDRGYTTRQEQTGKNGGAIETMQLDPERLKGMTDDELDALEKATGRLQRGDDRDPGGEAPAADENDYAAAINPDAGEVAT